MRIHIQRFIYMLLFVGFSLGPISQSQAQSVSDEFELALQEQGFSIVSTGYTWLRRVVVRATNGTYEREIVIARGSGQILQDNWNLIGTASRPALNNSLNRNNRLNENALGPKSDQNTRPDSNNRPNRPSGNSGGGPRP